MFFVVEAKIHHMAYEKPDGTFAHKTIIQADNAIEAGKKYQEYWDQKGLPSRTYYTVLDLKLYEEIP